MRLACARIGHANALRPRWNGTPWVWGGGGVSSDKVWKVKVKGWDFILNASFCPLPKWL